MVRRFVVAGLAAALVAPAVVVPPAVGSVLFSCSAATGSGSLSPGLGHNPTAQTFTASGSIGGCSNGQTATVAVGPLQSFPTRPLDCPTGLGGSKPDPADNTPILLGTDPSFTLNWASGADSSGVGKVKSAYAGANPPGWKFVLKITAGQYAGGKVKFKVDWSPTDSFTCANDSNRITAVSHSLDPGTSLIVQGAAAGPCGTAAQAPAHYDHVVIVMYENKQLGAVIGSPDAPYTTGLAHACGYATKYSDAGPFNSLPNYIALTSGRDDTPVQTDCEPSPTCSTTVDNVFRQVRAAGGSAISYQESMGSNCRLTNYGLYRPKHNPAAYYVGGDDRAACNTDDVDYVWFDPDNLPTLALITPNLVNDTHDGTVAQGDAWAATNVAAIFNGSDYRAGKTAVLWLWDENSHMPNVVIAPSVQPGTVTATPVNHYSALRAMEEMLGLPLLANAATATSLRGPFRL